MTIRIDTIAWAPGQVVLSIAGRLAEDAVPLLDGELTRVLVGAQRVVLDLKQVQFIDCAGLDLLRQRCLPRPSTTCHPQLRLSLRNGSRFVRLLLASRGMAVD